MPHGAGQEAFFCPASVAVHDDGDMAGDWAVLGDGLGAADWAHGVALWVGWEWGDYRGCLLRLYEDCVNDLWAGI